MSNSLVEVSHFLTLAVAPEVPPVTVSLKLKFPLPDDPGDAILIVGATVAACLTTTECNDRDSDNITHMLSGLAAKSFALYAAEK